MAALLVATPAFSQTKSVEIPFSSGDVELKHIVTGTVLAGPESAQVGAQASSWLSLFDGALATTLCTAHAMAYGNQKGNYAYGFAANLNVWDEVEDVVSSAKAGAGSSGVHMTGEATLRVASRTFGNYEYSFPLVHVLLTFTTTDVAAAVRVAAMGSSIEPSARLGGKLRATPGQVKMTGKVVWEYSEPGYMSGGDYCWSWVESNDLETPDNILLGGLKARPDLKASPEESYGTIEYDYDAVQLEACVGVDYWWEDGCYAEPVSWWERWFGHPPGLDTYTFKTYHATIADGDWSAGSGTLIIK